MTKEQPAETKQDKSLKGEISKMNRQEKKMGKVKHPTKPKPQRKDKTPVTLLSIKIKLNLDLTWLRRGKEQLPSRTANQASREAGLTGGSRVKDTQERKPEGRNTYSDADAGRECCLPQICPSEPGGRLRGRKIWLS